MNENPHPINVASHILLWVFVVGIAVYLIYSATHSTTNNNKFAPGTQQTNTNFQGPRLFDFYFGCTPVDRMKGNVTDDNHPHKNSSPTFNSSI